MICEICGQHFSTGVRLELEGSVVTACGNCSGYGKVVALISTVKERPKKIVETKTRVYEMQDFESEVTLVEDFGLKVKQAREKRGLKQGDLARLINEPESLVHRVEAGRFEPGENLVKKLERSLGVKLTVKVDGVPKLVGKTGVDVVTLGDVVVIKKKKSGG